MNAALPDMQTNTQDLSLLLFNSELQQALVDVRDASRHLNFPLH